VAKRHPQQTSALIELLATSDLEFAIIGGVAAIMHGSARMTLDLDILRGGSVLCNCLATSRTPNSGQFEQVEHAVR